MTGNELMTILSKLPKETLAKEVYVLTDDKDQLHEPLEVKHFTTYQYVNEDGVPIDPEESSDSSEITEQENLVIRCFWSTYLYDI